MHAQNNWLSADIDFWLVDSDELYIVQTHVSSCFTPDRKDVDEYKGQSRQAKPIWLNRKVVCLSYFKRSRSLVWTKANLMHEHCPIFSFIWEICLTHSANTGNKFGIIEMAGPLRPLSSLASRRGKSSTETVSGRNVTSNALWTTISPLARREVNLIRLLMNQILYVFWTSLRCSSPL